MRRREFIGVLGGAAAWPLAARAQRPNMPVIGILSAGSPDSEGELVAAFTRSLSQAGYVDGNNIALEYRWANNRFDRLPALAADLARRHVTVIHTVAGTITVLAAKGVTQLFRLFSARAATRSRPDWSQASTDLAATLPAST